MVKRTVHGPYRLYAELALLLIALASIAAWLYELLASPSNATVHRIEQFEFVVAGVFLADFLYLYRKAPNKHRFLKRNWFLLLACVPLTSQWAAALRALGLLRIIRIVRAGEHLYESIEDIETELKTRKKRS